VGAAVGLGASGYALHAHCLELLLPIVMATAAACVRLKEPSDDCILSIWSLGYQCTGSSSERLSCAPPYNRMQLPLPHPGNRNSFDDARVSAAPLEQSDLIRHSLDGDQRQIWGPAATALVLQQQWVSPGVHTSSASGLHGSPRAAYHPGISHPTPETYRSGSPLQRHQHQHHEVHQEQKPEHESHSQAHRHFSLSSATGDDQWKYSATQFAAVGSLWGDKGFHESFAVDSVPVASSAPQSGHH
jgi:hypothetical protein